jgi:uncharacterized protein YhaN
LRIPGVGHGNHDFDRLERVVSALAEAHRRQRDESAALRRKVEEKNRLIRTLESQLLDANQLRRDVAKRVDELIVQLTHLEAQFSDSDERGEQSG